MTKPTSTSKGVKQSITGEIGSLWNEADALQRSLISTAEQAEQADALLVKVKRAQRRIHEMYEQESRPALNTLEAIREGYRWAKQALSDAERICKTALLDWRKKLEEQEREARRKMREAQAQAIVTGKPAAPVAPATPAPELSSTTREEWRWEVQDLPKVPAQYLMVNAGAVQRALDRGVREIPGLRIYVKQVVVSGRAHQS